MHKINFMRIALFFFVLFAAATLPAQKDIKMVKVEAGTFTMGSNEKNFPEEHPPHEVTVNSFYISQYEINFDDYSAFCKAAGYAEPYGQSGFPATGLSWERAVMFCNWLSGREGLEHAYTIVRDDKKKIFEATCDFSKSGYRLPTEAEWEYAANGGHRAKRSVFSGSNSPYNIAWFSETYKGTEHKSGELQPNELGIYDMSGNVEEWCWDYYSNDYSKSGKVNPTGPETGDERVIRGGSRRSKMEYIMITRRQHKPQKEKDSYLGFRVVRSITDADE